MAAVLDTANQQPATFATRAEQTLAVLLQPGDLTPRVHAVVLCLTEAMLEATHRIAQLEQARERDGHDA